MSVHSQLELWLKAGSDGASLEAGLEHALGKGWARQGRGHPPLPAVAPAGARWRPLAPPLAGALSVVRWCVTV